LKHCNFSKWKQLEYP